MLFDYSYEIIIAIMIASTFVIGWACKMPSDYMPVSKIGMDAVRAQVKSILMEEFTGNRKTDKKRARNEVKAVLYGGSES